MLDHWAAKVVFKQGPGRYRRAAQFFIGTIVWMVSPGLAAGQGVQWSLRATTGPSARGICGMAHDVARGESILFGGTANVSTPLGDTWKWNGVAWTQVSPIGPTPTARWAHGMAYDANRHVIVLFGGWNGQGTLNDTWEWNGTSWTPITPTGSIPSARDVHAMAFDAARGEVVMFGGQTVASNGQVISYLNDTWTWNGSRWLQISTTGPLPTQRIGHALAYDSARGRTVLVGGLGPGGPLSDTWEWDGSTWQQKALSGPSGNYGIALAYDPVRARTVAFGGRSGDSRTWEWNGSAWSASSLVGPNTREFPAMIFDVSRHVITLFGGFNPVFGDTWELALVDDCNVNGIPDDLDVLDGYSLDCDHDYVPDECESPPCSRPDLIVTVVSPPASGVAGQQVDIQYTIQNVSVIAASGTCTDRISYSTDNQIGNDLQAASTQYNLDLGPGQTLNRTVTVTLPGQAGPRYVVVSTNVTQSIDEGPNGGNNSTISGAAVNVQAIPLPDLEVTSVTPPSMAINSGSSTSVTWTVRNSGTASTSAAQWVDQVLVSNLPNLAFGGNGSDAALCGDPFVAYASYVSNPEYLGVGDSYSQTATITLPRNVHGNFYVYVIADRAGCGQVIGDVPELNELNNLSRSTTSFVVNLQPQPDLTPVGITHLSLAQTTQYFTVSWVDRNMGQGPTDTGMWTDAVYLSTNNQASVAGDRLLRTRERTGGLLAAGASDPVASITALLPTSIPDGNYYVKVAVDASNQIPEVETPDNNIQVSPIPVNISQAPLVNLAMIQPPTAVSLWYPAQPITVNYQAGNRGAPPTLGLSWVDRAYLSTDTILSPATDIPLGSLTRSTIYTNGSFDLPDYSGQIQAVLPRNLAQGNYYVIVVLDADNQVDEGTGENENVAVSSAHQVQWVPTDLTIAPIAPVPTSAAAGQSFLIAWQVSNAGAAVTPVGAWVDAVYLSTDTSLDAGDTLILTKSRSGQLLGGGSYSAQDFAAIPSNKPPGNYYLILQTDRNDDVYEQAPGEGNNVNAAPIPFTVTPAIVTYVADLQATALTAPSTIQPGQSFGVSYTVTNVGNIVTAATAWIDRIYLSVDGQLGSDDILLDTAAHSGALGSQAAYTSPRSITVPASTQPGSYYLIVQIDAGGQVFEASESNNTRVAAMSVPGPPVPRANLQVSAVSADATATPGQPLSVSWTVTNVGAVATAVSAWRDTLYLSNDQLPGNDLFLGNYQQMAGLGIGQSRVTTAAFNVPCGTSGAWYVLVLTDSGGNVAEGNFENDNAGASTVTTQVASLQAPNLRVPTVTAPASAVAGQAIHVTWTPRNAGGPTCASGWSDGVFLSRDTILDSNGDVFLGAFSHTMPLPSGDAAPITQPFTIPPGLSGSYYVIVRADYLNQLSEGVETDNDGLSTALSVALPQPCDLTVTDVSVGGSYLVGDAVNFHWQVTNASSVPVTGVWTDSVYLSADANWSTDDVLVGRFASDPTTLGANGSAPRDVSANLPAVSQPGNYHVIVKTDVLNQIPETNNANNSLASASTLGIGVRLLALETPFSGPLATGASQYFALTLPAGETVRIELSHTSPSAWTELFVRENVLPTPAQFDQKVDLPNSPSQLLFIPTTHAATYYILARATAGTVTPGGDQMTIVARVVPFGIESALPRNLGNGDRVTLRISGSRFSSGTSVALLGPGGQVVTPTTVAFLDGRHLRARFDLTGAPFGEYDVRVSETSGSNAALSGAVVVEPAMPVAATVSGSGSLFPRADGAFQANATIVNASNVDSPVVTVMARFKGHVRIGWNRPDSALPRVNDIKASGFDWPARSPTAFFQDDYTVDMFHLRDLSPGESIPVSALVTQLSAGDFQFDFGVHAGTQSEFASNVYGILESARQSLVNTNTATMAPDLRAVLLDPVGWRAYFEGALVAYGLVDAGAFPGVSLACDNVLPCAASVATNVLLTEVFDCGLLPTPSANACRLIKALHLVHGGLACYHQHCSLQCETCVEGRYEWGACSFADVAGSYFTSITQGCGRAQAAVDPNEKIGPTGGSGGSGGGGLQLSANNAMRYEIHFENLPTATATVNTITITDDLDSALNPGSVRLGAVRIGDVTLTQLQNRISFQGQIDLSATKGVYLNVLAGVNANQRQAFWIFETIDPATGERPSDPNRGILPPEDSSGRGRGFIAFEVSPSPGAGTGAPIRNGAKITFDSEPSIYTNTVINNVDMDLPTSTVIPIPSVTASGAIPLTWAGYDQAGGSALRDFTIYVFGRTSPLVLFDPALAVTAPNLNQVTEQSGQFTGLPGRKYSFYSIARDNAGNLELPPPEPDAETLVPLDAPVAAVAALRTGVTLKLDLGLNSPAIRNAGDTEYAVMETASNRFVDINGRLGTIPVWRTPVVWGSLATIRALRPSTTFQFAIKARNGFGDGPTGPTINTATRSLGDVNGDGQQNGADLQAVQAALGTVYGQPGFDAAADLNGDDRVTAADVDILLLVSNCINGGTGDFDGNGVVNAQDVPSFISALLVPTQSGVCIGDLNLDLRLDGLDVQQFVRIVH